jgi:hypothetical protein
VLGLVLAAVGGCSLSADSAVAERAQKRWDALISGDTAEAYRYYTDAFRQTTPYEHFKNQVHGTGLWSGAKVDKVACEASGKRCKVDVDVTVTMKMRGLSMPVDTTDRVSETWVKDGWFSDWRYVKQ